MRRWATVAVLVAAVMGGPAAGGAAAAFPGRDGPILFDVFRTGRQATASIWSIRSDGTGLHRVRREPRAKRGSRRPAPPTDGGSWRSGR